LVNPVNPILEYNIFLSEPMDETNALASIKFSNGALGSLTYKF